MKNRNKLPDIDCFLAGKVKIIRLLNNMSQRELAERVGITFQQVQKYESARNKMSLDKFTKICEILNCSPSELLKEYKCSDNDNITEYPNTPDINKLYRIYKLCRSFYNKLGEIFKKPKESINY